MVWDWGLENPGQNGYNYLSRFHDFKHTHVSLLLQSGADIRTVQEICGWSDLKILERYAHTNAPLKSAAVTRIPLPDLSEYEI